MDREKDDGGDEMVERGNWSNKADFILSCVGWAVGLGNVWRFPMLCFEHGGASFLIPYFIMLLVAGLPIFLLELSVGQFNSSGPITSWRMCPLFTGVGWCVTFITGMVCVYYTTIIAYSIYYMMASFVNMNTEVPWAVCDPAWATTSCKDTPYPDFNSFGDDEAARYTAVLSIMNTDCTTKPENLEIYMNSTSTTGLTIADLNSSILLSDAYKHCKTKFSTPSGEYWGRYFLEIQDSNGIGDIGGMNWKIFVSLLFAWLIMFLCMMKGIKSTGKVVWFTATFPYLILTVLLIRGLTLPYGYEEGLKFYLVPEEDALKAALKDPTVWADAASQIFYSLGVGFGVLVTFGSYSKFHSHCYRDAVIVTVVNSFTSLYAGAAIFSILGYMAHQTNQSVKEVVAGGPGLAFVAFPAGIAQLPASSLWGFLFFFMLITLGMDSVFGALEGVISALIDLAPHKLRPHQTKFRFLICLIGFGLAIPQATKGGIYILGLMDHYSAKFGLLAAAFFEVVGVIWVYGLSNFMNDFKMMIGYRPNIYWMATWSLLAPASIILILVMSAIEYKEAADGTYVLESWAQWIGWCMVIVPLSLILFGALAQLILHAARNRAGCCAAFKSTLKPTSDWGPALDKYRALDKRYRLLGEDETDRNHDNERYKVNNGYVSDDVHLNKVYISKM